MTCNRVSQTHSPVRVVVVSDSHGYAERLERLMAFINSTEGLVFCGDGMRDIIRVRGGITVPITCVKGNNDFGLIPDIVDHTIMSIGETRVFVTHGHLLGARNGRALMAVTAKSNDCSLVFFGHTHKYTDIEDDAVRFINPGALCNGSYAVVTFDGKKITSEQMFID